MKLPIAVLVSGSGSNLQSIIDRIEAQVLDAEIKLVISNRAGAYGLERAKKHGIKSLCLSHKDFATREDFDQAMVDAIRAEGAQAVVCAGFMRILTPVFLNSFPGKVINIHPALLPSFPGVHGQGDANAYGVKVSGCTVHFVDEKTDHGPIIIQAVVPAHGGEDADALAARILKLEHRVFPQAVQWLAQGRLEIKDRHVMLHPGEESIAPPESSLVNPPLEKGF